MKSMVVRNSGKAANRRKSAPLMEHLEGRQFLSVVPHLTPKGMIITAVEGQAFNGAVSTFTDGTGGVGDSLGNYTATITWGDPATPTANTSTGTVTTDGLGNFTVTGSHTYANPSPPVGRVVRVTVVDSAGERSIPPFAVSHARVADAPITVSPGSNFSAVVNSVPAVPVVVATFTDADPNPFNGTKLKDTATINWGDGVVTAGVITENSSTHVFSVTGTRVFPRVSKADPNNPGSYIPFNVVTSIRDTGVVRGTAAVQGTITPPLPTTTPNLVGTYTGTVNVKVKVAFITVGKNEPMVIQINSQNLESISGSITIDGTTVASGTFNGAAFQGTPSVERTNGLVIFSDTGSGFSVNVVGKIITNKATGLADTFAGNIVASGIPVIGKLNASFILTKTA